MREIKLFDSLVERAGVLAIVEREDSGEFTATVADPAGNVLLAMSGYETIESPLPMDAEPLAALRKVLVGRDSEETA